ncbi:MAG: spore coat biosynthesis protein F [Leptospira sp.]|nr:spore coat biosynthesis protein F [Leptospira sp.]
MNGIHSTPKPYLLIQARLGSTRLKGKVLKSLSPEQYPDLTILDHLHKRLLFLFPNEQIIFLIPSQDRELSNYLESKSINYFFGSENNVRERYIQCAKHYGIKDIFRLTGDNPFVDLQSIQYLWEALFYLKSRFYSLAMTGLPLGMGIECFSYESLIYNNDIYNEERHREHVSLHIKEHPEIHQIHRITAPHLKPEERNLSNRIRLTIDEPKDLEFARNVWSYFKDTNQFFGAKEIYELYKLDPKFFDANASIEQVSFPLPEPKPLAKKCEVIYGDPIEFGTGHMERSISLSIYLQMNEIETELINSKTYKKEQTNSEKQIPNDESSKRIRIFDVREDFADENEAFFIDNLKHPPNEDNSAFFLPHPSEDYSSKENISFFTSPILSGFSSVNVTKQNKLQLLVYLGNLDQKQTELVDEFILNTLQDTFSLDLLFRIGGTFPKNPKIKYIQRIQKIPFYRLIQESDFVLTYFGLTLLESMYLSKKVFVVGISEIHEHLGEFVSNLFGVPYLGNLSQLSLKNNFTQRNINYGLNPSNLVSESGSKNKYLTLDAHHKILNWIENKK